MAVVCSGMVCVTSICSFDIESGLRRATTLYRHFHIRQQWLPIPSRTLLDLMHVRNHIRGQFQNNAAPTTRVRSLNSKLHSSPNVHIIRHGQSLHNVDRGYPGRDPPLTEKGESDAKLIRIPSSTDSDSDLPDLILISP